MMKLLLVKRFILLLDIKHVNFRSIHKTRSRIPQALSIKSKSFGTIELLGLDIETYRKWLAFQMNADMTWGNIDIDHVKQISLFNISKDEKLRKEFIWKNTQPLLKQAHQQTGTKFIFLDYRLQFIKAYQFFRLDEEGLNQNLH